MEENLHLSGLQAYLMSRQPGTFRPLPRVRCFDGFEMSVQAHSICYCEPREDVGPWTEVEVGYLNRLEPLLFPYADDKGEWLETIYAYVPIELVAAVIELHGGMLTRL